MDIDNARLLRLIVHRVGNRAREEGTRLSQSAIDAGPEVAAILVEHFLAGTVDGGARYAFTHESTLDLNEVRRFSIDALNDDKAFEDASRAIARHLYSKSTHPGVAGGDLFVALFESDDSSGNGARALGLFKTEVTERFLVVDDASSDLQVKGLSGIDPRHLQKAALIFADDETVIALERGKSRTRYWLEDFLQLAPIQSEEDVTRFVSSLAKRASSELSDPSRQTAFKASMAERLAPGETPRVADLLELTAEFVGFDALSSIADDIEAGLGYTLDRDAIADVRQIKRSLNSMLRSTPVTPGVDLVFSKGVTASAVEVSQPDGSGVIHIVIKLQGPR
ncbi:nucleoid-associated protein [Luteibacter sp. PPL201]|uniref:Nucleoid-associated protein n=1 Tax=Luteibacter sahnii TaxID=3021977 RepID=A0ABT6BFT7_9GAMM